MHRKNLTGRKAIFVFALAWVAGSAIGCCHTGDQTVGPGADIASGATLTPAIRAATTGSAPSSATILFDDAKDGVRLQYTCDWVAKPDPDYVLQLVPADGSTGRRIVLDIPDLPFHLPGMVQLGLVENGYLNDLKEKHKDIKVESSADQAIGRGAKARLVLSSWTQDGGPHRNVALLIVRNDHVYILACGSDPAHLAATRADFDAIAESLLWTK